MGGEKPKYNRNVFENADGGADRVLDSYKRIREVVDLCEEKDSFFKELMSDGVKHKSSLAEKHMSDRKKHLKGK
jgi:hypothetical protein